MSVNVRITRLGGFVCVCLLALFAGQAAAAQISVVEIDLRTSDIVYDRLSNRVYASVPASAGLPYGNRVAAINPYTGVIESSVFVGSDPNRLAVSDEGTNLFVGLDGARAVRRVDLTSFSAAEQMGLGSCGAEDIEVMPGQADTIAVALRLFGLSPRTAGVAMYDSFVQRPQSAGLGNNVVFNGDGTELYGFLPELSSKTVSRALVTPEGLVGDGSRSYHVGGGGEVQWADGKLYFDSGQVLDAQTLDFVGSFPTGGAVTPDSASDVVLFLGGAGHTAAICDMETFIQIDTIDVDTGGAGLGDPIRFGSNGYAFRTSADKVFFVRHPLLGPEPSVASFASTLETVHNVDFGTLIQGDPSATEPFEIWNIADPVSGVDLDLLSISGSGDTSLLTTDLSPFTDLGAGSSDLFTASMDTSTAGDFSATYALSFSDELGTDQLLTLNLSGSVVPEPSTLVLLGMGVVVLFAWYRRRSRASP